MSIMKNKMMNERCPSLYKQESSKLPILFNQSIAWLLGYAEQNSVK